METNEVMTGASFDGDGNRIPPERPLFGNIDQPTPPVQQEPVQSESTPPAAETVPVVTTTPEPAPPAAPEPPKPAETVVKEPTLDELIAKADRKEVLKKLGLDEFDIDFVDNRRNGGDPYKYLEVKTRDWGKVSDVDVLRHDLRKRYPGLTPDEFEILAEEEILKPYKVNEEFVDEREKTAAQLKLRLAAEQKRTAFQEEDSRYVIPGREPDKEEERLMAAAAQAKQEFLDTLNESQATKSLLSDKVIVAGAGETTTRIPVEPEQLMDYITNDGKFFSVFHDQNGQMDFGLLYATLAFAKNRQGYEKALIDYGKTLGVKNEIDTLHAIPKETVPQSGEVKESLREAFTRRGVDVPRA